MNKNTSPALDKNLLRRLKSGDETAFESLYWAYNSHLFNFIHSILYDKSLAEDLTQNVFLKIWEKREVINPEQGIDAYLFTIARNLVYKETEKSLRSSAVMNFLSRQLSDQDSETEDNLDAESLREYIQTLVEQMPTARREIFKLSRYEHLSNKEIATCLQLSEKTVETQLYRALSYLREHLNSGKVLAFLLLFLLTNVK